MASFLQCLRRPLVLQRLSLFWFFSLECLFQRCAMTILSFITVLTPTLIISSCGPDPAIWIWWYFADITGNPQECQVFIFIASNSSSAFSDFKAQVTVPLEVFMDVFHLGPVPPMSIYGFVILFWFLRDVLAQMFPK